MPVEVKLDGAPAYTANSGREGDTISLIVREFTSTEDGELFVSRLEGLPNDILNLLPRDKCVAPSQIDHLLAIIQRDGTATVYLNEVQLESSVRVKRAIRKGEAVTGSDIADISRVRFGGITVPPTAGMLFVFSCGWRKALFFDVAPISGDDPQPRDYDLEVALGQYHSYLLFQHLFSISPQTWERLFDRGWFPFVRLSVPIVKRLVAFTRDGLDPDELLPTIESEIHDDHASRLERWNTHPVSSHHAAPLANALDRYNAGDYCSAISILYTKIEGVLRSHSMLSEKPDPSQAGLAASAVSSVDIGERPFSLLLPDRFRQYLDRVYFADFDPTLPSGVSRNTVSHGVVPPDEYSAKWTVIAILTLDQLAFFLSSEAE